MKICVISAIDCSSYLSSLDDGFEKIDVLVPAKGIEPLFPEDCISKFNTSKCRVSFVSNKEEALFSKLEEIDADVLISIGWRWILSKKIINSVKTCINIHPAILPNYKGYHTEPYIIKNGENIHGITAHYLTEGLDDGDIIMQETFSITPFSTVNSLKKKVLDNSGSFFNKLLKHISTNKIISIPQDSTIKSTLAKKRKPIDSEVDSSLSLTSLYNEIRCCDPDAYPAFFYVNGRKIGIKLFSLEGVKEDEFEI